jgi:O-antigen/teichoic acid export membrane protein
LRSVEIANTLGEVYCAVMWPNDAADPAPEFLSRIRRETQASVRGTLRWTRILGGPTVVSTAASAITLVANILLLRLLSLADAGRLVLLLACLDAVGLLASLGQPTLIQRIYSTKDDQRFDWVNDLIATQGLGMPILAAGAAGCLILYKLQLVQAAFILAVGIPIVAGAGVSSMLTARRHYAWSSLLVRLPNSLLILPAIMSLIDPRWARLDLVLLCYLVASTIVLLFSLALLSRHIVRGSLRISMKDRLVGVWFLGTQLTSLLPEEGLIAIAGLLLNPAQLATYGAVSVLLGPFRIVADVFRRVFITELLQKDRPASSRVTTGLCGLSVGLGVAAAVLGGPVIHLIYSGRYDEGINFVPWLALAGTLMLAETLPRSHIIGRAPRPVLSRMILGHSITGIVGAFAGYGLTAGMAGLGTSIAAALISGGRSAVSYRIFQKTRSEEAVEVPDLRRA